MPRPSRTVIVIVLLAVTALVPIVSLAHDTWVETHTAVVRTGDVVRVDLMLGNHGNHHRDFKLAGKADPSEGTFEVITPDGSRHDLSAAATDVGSEGNPGYWTTRFQPSAAGLYTVVQTSDKVVSYAPLRSIKSAKAFVVASDQLDAVPANLPGYDRVLGHPLELVPQTNPVAPMSPGQPITVRLLYKGQPLAGATVSFIPRGVTLAAHGFDDRYERRTDASGLVTFEPDRANTYLIVAHHADDDSGETHEGTKYAATLTVHVPAVCPCVCDE